MDGRGENPLNLILVVFALLGLIRKLSLRRVLCWCLNVLSLMTFLWLTRLKKFTYSNQIQCFISGFV